MSRVIGVLSGKGGVGKTTITANLGAALTNIFKKNIVICDMNIHASHLGLHLGMYEDPPATLRDVLKGKMPITNAIYMHPQTGIKIICAPLNRECKNPTQTEIGQLVSQIKNNYDMVILDCAPGLGEEATAAISAIDDALVITTPDLPSVIDAVKALDILRKKNKNILGVVINRFDNKSYMLTENEIASTCNCRIVSRIPEDKKIPESISKGIPVVLIYPDCTASRSLKNLASYISGSYYREENIMDRIKNFFNFEKFNF